MNRARGPARSPDPVAATSPDSRSREPLGPVLRWTLAFLQPHRARVWALAGLSVAEIALRALGPWPLQALVDHLVSADAQPVSPGGAAGAGGRAASPLLAVVHRVLPAASPAGTLLTIVLVGVALQLAHQAVLLLHSRQFTRLAQRVVFDLRASLFTHLQYLPLGHHQRASLADAIYRLETDAAFLESLLLRGLFPMVFSALTLVVMFAVLWRIDAVLATLSIVVVPCLYACLRVFMRRMRLQAAHAKELESAAVAHVYASLSAIRLVKTFAREDHEVDRFSAAASHAMRERLTVVRHESWFAFLVGAVTVIGSSMVLALGGLHVLRGQLTVGTLLVVVAYLGFVYGPMSAIATTAGSLQHALASARRVRELLGIPREGAQEGATIDPPRFRGEVRFERVSFAYGPGQPVLDQVSFTAKPGETVALVGASGAGKTTLLNLIGRFYEPTGGRVLIDGTDVARFRLRGLREQIAVVLQDSIVMPGSIGENILYGRLTATDHEVVLAARAAHCEEFVAGFRRGFDTPLGESGGGLSGGQRQRVSIARAFLKDAPILILDEPTAALDTLAEQAILASLRQLRAGRTTFVIAHRLSSVQDADHILVLDAGRIVAQGTHGELLASSPHYRKLCAALAADPSPGTTAAPGLPATTS